MKQKISIIPPNSGDQICAFFLTYRPNKGFPDNIKNILKQVGLIVIVDDGASEADKKQLRDWFGNNPKIILYHLKNNDGIPLCMNIGFEIAKQNGYQWVLGFDDDTQINPKLVDRLIINLKNVHFGKPVAVSAMSWVESGSCEREKIFKERSGWMEKRAVIGSGSLYSIKAYEIIGPFPNEYFLGCTDYEYCMRARAKGFRVIRFNEIGMAQRLGNPSIHQFGPIAIKTYNYSAPRYYYGFRNNLMIVRANAIRDPIYAAAVFLYFIKTFVAVGTYEEDGIRKNWYMLRGLWHGIIRKMGKNIADE